MQKIFNKKSPIREKGRERRKGTEKRICTLIDAIKTDLSLNSPIRKI